MACRPTGYARVGLDGTARAVRAAAVVGARYEGDPPEPYEPFYMAVGDQVVAKGDKRVDYVFLVNCAGPAPARDVHVWLAYGAVGEEVRHTEERHVGLLGTGEERKVEFQESNSPGGCVPRDGALMGR
jgi:hypothetical protein